MRMLMRLAAIAILSSAPALGATGKVDQASVALKCDALKSQYDKAVAQLDNEMLAKAQEALIAYGKDLDALQKALQKQGNLDAYLAAKKEKERFDSDKSVPDATGQPDIDRLAEAYRKTMDAGRACHAKSVLAQSQKYAAALEALVKELVRANELELAKKANDELSRVQSLVAAARATAPAPEKPGNESAAAEDKPAPPDGAEHPAVASSTELRMRGSGAIEAWKPSKIAVGKGDWISVKITNAKKDSSLSLQKPKRDADRWARFPAVVVSVKTKSGASCVASRDKRGRNRNGVLLVPEDGVLQYMCAAESDIVADVEIRITKEEPESQVTFE